MLPSVTSTPYSWHWGLLIWCVMGSTRYVSVYTPAMSLNKMECMGKNCFIKAGERLYPLFFIRYTVLTVIGLSALSSWLSSLLIDLLSHITATMPISCLFLHTIYVVSYTNRGRFILNILKNSLNHGFLISVRDRASHWLQVAKWNDICCWQIL